MEAENVRHLKCGVKMKRKAVMAAVRALYRANASTYRRLRREAREWTCG